MNNIVQTAIQAADAERKPYTLRVTLLRGEVEGTVEKIEGDVLVLHTTERVMYISCSHVSMVEIVEAPSDHS